MQDGTHSFGYWLRRRRKALDLTQEALAQRVSCSGFSIRKIEADERRPSRGLADRLATSLGIPEEARGKFLDAARTARNVDRLRLDATPVNGAARVDAAGAIPDPSLAVTVRPAVEAAPLVGRSSEVGLLTRLVADLGAGGGQAVLIEGEAGIGKSRLLREITHHALAQNMPTLATNCYEIERATPYQPVIDLVTRALDRMTDVALRALAPVYLAELAVLVPELCERLPGLPTLSNDFPEARQARLPRAVDHILEAWRGGRPSILMVDDIQWADDASAQVLQYLARKAAQRPVLVIYAYRDEEFDNDERLARLVGSLCREIDVRRMPLARLALADTERLVALLADARLDATNLAVRLHRETEGNPFFLMSILQSLREGETRLESRVSGATGLLPDALRAAVRVRLAHVSPEIRPLLQTAAVLGRRFDFDTLLEATRVSEPRLLQALDALVRRRLLSEEPEGGVYDFSHDKVREVVYRDIGGARRRLLHRSVAEALERSDASETHERYAQLAEHYERAQVWSKALHYLILAGRQAQALFAMRDALSWLDRAVALSDAHPRSVDQVQRFALYEQRGAARAQAGQTQGAVADLSRVVTMARALGEPGRIRDALVRLGMAFRRADAYDEAIACLGEALAESRAMNDERHVADTLYHLGTVAWSNGQNDRATEFHQQAVEICERAGFADLVAVQAHHGRGEAHFANAEPAMAIDCYTRSLELARGIGDRSYESENLMMIGYACIGTKGLGDYPRAMENFEAALSIARAADLQWHIGPSLLGIEHVRACTGQYGSALAGMRKALQWLESLGQVRYQLIAHNFIGHLLLDLGRNQLALEQLERGLALGRSTGILFWRAAIEAQVAAAQSRLGQHNVAPALQATLERTRRTAERYLMVRCLDRLAEITLAAGDARRCQAYADELLAVAEANSLRELEASARHWRGEAWLAQRSYAQAQADLSRAAALARDIGRISIEMDAEAALARLFEAQGQGDAAQRHVGRARALEQAIERSLESFGLPPRSSAPRVPPTGAPTAHRRPRDGGQG